MTGGGHAVFVGGRSCGRAPPSFCQRLFALLLLVAGPGSFQLDLFRSGGVDLCGRLFFVYLMQVHGVVCG